MTIIQQKIIISKKILPFRGKFVFLQSFSEEKGRLAEGLGTGLQNLLLRFKSGSDLYNKLGAETPSFFLFP